MIRPTVKNEINWATVVAVAGMALTVGGLILKTGEFTNTVKHLTEAQSVYRAETQQRFAALEEMSDKYDNLAYRVTVQEQAAAQTNAAIEELKRSLADQSADIKVIREILTRLDQKSQ